MVDPDACPGEHRGAPGAFSANEQMGLATHPTPLGRLEGMAIQYGNLGIIFATRGELDEAGKRWTKARDLYAKIGMPQMVEKHQRWLDGLPDAGEDRS